jgi:hypothetical protein
VNKGLQLELSAATLPSLPTIISSLSNCLASSQPLPTPLACTRQLKSLASEPNSHEPNPSSSSPKTPSSPSKPAEGVWGQERDRAGLRAASNRRELGESGEYGETFFLRVRPFALPASLLPLLFGSSLDMVFRLSRPLVDNLRRLPPSHLPSFSLLFTLQSAFLPLPTRRAPPSRCFLPQRRLASAQVSRSPLPSQHDLARDRFAFALPRPWPVVVSCYARYLLPTCKPTFCLSSSRL